MNLTLFRAWLRVAGFLLLLLSPTAALAQESDFPGPENQMATYQSYTGLSELITLVCDDAINKLQGFFGPTLVEVRPFISFGQFQHNKISALGISLANQMMALINNDTILHAEATMQDKGSDRQYTQQLQGCLQEVDGYLRIHINAANVYGEKLSYVTSVEMSEPIYRALHTYLVTVEN